jgi:energy-coupling factor transporter ATP-binding protein EcfA2
MTQAVRLTGVTKNYGPVRAVDGIDLALGRGETVALLGPNGAGKSTTINMLLGLIAADHGTVEVFGTAPAQRSSRARSARCCRRRASRPTPPCGAGGARPRAVQGSVAHQGNSGDSRTDRHRRTAGWTSFRVGSPSASGSPSRWPATPSCSCSTSRLWPWTSRAGRLLGVPCAASPRPAGPYSSRRTTSRRPTTTPTA